MTEKRQKNIIVQAIKKQTYYIDKFHVFKHVQDGFNAIRKRLSDELPPKEKAFVKGNWRLLAHNASALDYKGQAKLKEILDKCPVLQEPYGIKEDFSGIYNAESHKEAEALYDKWAGRASAFDEFSDMLNMADRWHEYIFNYFDHPYTNAATEALNRLAKEISAKGRGYSYDVLKAKAIYGTTAVKPAKYEYRSDYGSIMAHDYAVGFMMYGQIANHMPKTEKQDKILAAVPGTDIEELIEEIITERKYA